MTQRTSEWTAFENATEVLDSLLLAWRRINPDAGLSRTAGATLGTLYRYGPMRLTTLAERESVTQPAMTGLIGRLEAQGMVNRTADPSDGRAVLIGVTPAGEALVQRHRRHFADTVADMVRTLPAEDFERLVDALPALRRLSDAAHAHTNQNPEDPR